MNDLISRQAALEKVRAMQTYKLFVGDDMILVDKAEVQTELMMLPTAQTEPQWIPVSERLPKDDDYKPFSCAYYEDGAVLYCTKDGEIGFGWYYESTREWGNEDDIPPGEVIAWMPLPEPYNPNKIKENEQ